LTAPELPDRKKVVGFRVTEEEALARKNQRKLLELLGKLEWDNLFDYKIERTRIGDTCYTSPMSDLGLTHVAFLVKDIERSIAFYAKYAAMKVVHRRDDEKSKVAWIGDHTRPFVIVLVESREAAAEEPLGPFGHLGVAVESRAEVERLAGEARREGILAREPKDSGPPVGYWTFIADPDGNMLELSYGQEVAFTEQSARTRPK